MNDHPYREPSTPTAQKAKPDTGAKVKSIKWNPKYAPKPSLASDVFMYACITLLLLAAAGITGEVVNRVNLVVEAWTTPIGKIANDTVDADSQITKAVWSDSDVSDGSYLNLAQKLCEVDIVSWMDKLLKRVDVNKNYCDEQ